MENIKLNKGKFFTAEGLDCSGKSTQCKLLFDYLTANNYPAILTKEPTENEIGLLIRKALKKEVEIDPLALAALFAADRMEHLNVPQTGIKKQLAEGNTVICDRYVLSNYAYQVSQGVSPEFILQLNSQALKPDLVIFIHADKDLCLERFKSRNNIEIFETADFLNKVYQNYVTGMMKLSNTWNIKIVNGNNSIEEVHNSIIDLIKEIL
jgi:dTMP kinase